MDSNTNNIIRIRPSYNYKKGFRSKILENNKFERAFINSEGVCGRIICDERSAYQEFRYYDNPTYYILFSYPDNIFQKLSVYDIKYDYINLAFNTKKLYEFNEEDINAMLENVSPSKRGDTDSNKNFNKMVETVQKFLKQMII